MKKTKLLFLILLVLAVTASAVPALSSGITPFSFRNGILFGMNDKEIIQTEAGNGQVPQDRWESIDLLPGTRLLATDEKVKVSKYEAKPGYFMVNDKMVIAAYDFQNVPSEAFNDITAALSAVYGPAQAADPAEFLRIMSPFVQTIDQADTSQMSLTSWKLNNVTIYQYYYYTDMFGVLYCDPGWNGQAIDTTGI